MPFPLPDVNPRSFGFRFRPSSRKSLGSRRNSQSGVHADAHGAMEIRSEHEIPSESSRNHVRVGRFEWEETTKTLWNLDEGRMDSKNKLAQTIAGKELSWLEVMPWVGNAQEALEIFGISSDQVIPFCWIINSDYDFLAFRNSDKSDSKISKIRPYLIRLAFRRWVWINSKFWKIRRPNMRKPGFARKTTTFPTARSRKPSNVLLIKLSQDMDLNMPRKDIHAKFGWIEFEDGKTRFYSETRELGHVEIIMFWEVSQMSRLSHLWKQAAFMPVTQEWRGSRGEFRSFLYSFKLAAQTWLFRALVRGRRREIDILDLMNGA